MILVNLVDGSQLHVVGDLGNNRISCDYIISAKALLRKREWILIFPTLCQDTNRCNRPVKIW
jgi:hypothetical protein